MKNIIKLFFLFFFILYVNRILYAQPGQLDTTFGQGGKVTTAINVFGNSQAQAIAMQDDGKFVVAGSADNGNNDLNFCVARFNPDGSLDNSFGVNGIVITEINSNEDDKATSVAMQTDGKIVAAGYAWTGVDYDFALVRYNQNGSLDSTFGTNGVEITPIGDHLNDNAYAMLIQNDGKIIAAGSYNNGNDVDFAVVRYNPNGNPDASFGKDGNGIDTIHLGDGFDRVYAITLQSDPKGTGGKIILAGRTYNDGTSNDFAVLRLNSDGTKDKLFESTDFRHSTDIAFSVVIQDSGKIVVGGHSNSNVTGYDWAFARYNEDGSLDSTFGTNKDGKVILKPTNNNDRCQSLAIDSNNKIIAAGHSSNGNDFDFTIMRLNSGGTPDSTFGNKGIKIIPVGSHDDVVNTVLIQKDPAGTGEKIVAAGYSFNDVSEYDDFTIARFNADGTPDNTFNNNGIVTTPIGYSGTFPPSIVIQDNGKIITGFYSYDYDDGEIVLACYSPGGILDTTFGYAGIKHTSIVDPETEFPLALTQDNGKIIAVGSSETPMSMGSDLDFMLLRYTSNGNLDDTFGEKNSGKVFTDFGSSNNDVANSVAIQSDGKIIAAGYSYNGSNNDFALARYNEDGSLDGTFGVNGKLTTPVGSSTDEANSVAVQNDGKIVAAGISYNGNDYDLILVRYIKDGKGLDNSFGNEGIVATPIEMKTSNILFASVHWSVVIQSDGKIIAAGNSHNGSDYDFCLVRYNTDGTTDSTFGTDGIVNTPIGNSTNDFANSIKIQSNGDKDLRIVASGFTYDDNFSGFAVVRYNMDGSLDNNFGTNGDVITSIGLSYSYASSIAIQNNGNIVAAGISLFPAYSPYYFSDVLSLVRYNGDIITTGVSEDNNTNLPDLFALEQNYPNPFNPTTKIKYSLPNVGAAYMHPIHTTLKVYDILGKEAATIVNREQPPGNYEVEFNAAALSSGVYFYKLKAGNFTETKKMILLR